MTKSLQEQLREALESNEIFKSLQLVAQGADANIQNKRGDTLLHLILDELSNGIEYDYGDEDIEVCAMELPSDFLVHDNKINLINLINYLRTLKNAKLLQNQNEDTPLHIFSGVVYKHLELEQLNKLTNILTNNVPLEDINCFNKRGVTAFALSVFHNIPQAECLAQVRSINVNIGGAKDFGYDHHWGLTDDMWSKVEGNKWTYKSKGHFLPKDCTPLMAACFFDNRPLLNVLVTRDDLLPTSDYFQTLSGPLIEILAGETNVHLATVNNNLELLKFLLEISGPQALFKVNEQGHTILHKSCHYKYHTIIQFLLNKEELSKVFTHHEFDDKIYSEFVNYESQQGMAATCYNLWISTHDEQLESDYEAFMRCEEYQAFKVDAQGNSLFHIILAMGYHALVDLAMARDDFPEKAFAQKNSQGHSAIGIAIDSDSPQLIRKLAELSYSRKDIEPNKMERFFLNLRNKLVAFAEESWFGENITISGLNVDELLNVYLEKKTFKSYADFKETEVEAEVHVEYLMSGTHDPNRSMQWEKDLKHNVTLMLKQHIQFEDERGYALCADLQEISRTFAALRPLIESAYDKNSEYDDNIIHVRYYGCKITIKYHVTDSFHNVRHEVEVGYQDVVSGMGDEWDYVKRDQHPEEGVEYKTHAEINFIPYVPLMYFVLKQIHEAMEQRHAEDIDLAAKKLEAFLEFPFLLNEQFISPVCDQYRQLTNTYSYAPKEIQPLLLKKIRSQNALFLKLEELSVTEEVSVDYVLDYERIQSANDPFPILKEGARIQSDDSRSNEFPVILYEFATFMCYRMNVLFKSEGPICRSSDKFLSLLDSMSRLLELNYMCAAVSYVNDQFFISSNYGSTRMLGSDRNAICNKFNDIIVPQILNYLCDYANHSLTNREAEALKILNQVVPGYANNTQIKASKKIMKQVTDEIRTKIIEFLYKNNNEVSQLIQRNEDSPDDTAYMLSDVFTMVSLEFPMFQEANTDNKKHEICEFIYRIYRLCRDLKKLEEAVTSEDPDELFSKNVLATLKNPAVPSKSKFVLVPNDSFMHTETALLDYILGKNFDIAGLYIGVSRICCPLCTLFVQAINQKSNDKGFIYTHGSHQNIPDSWTFPKVLIQDKELLANFLGGTTSKLYSVFFHMSDKEKPVALKLIQGMNKKILENHCKECADLKELYSILDKYPTQHITLPEPSLTAISEHFVLLDADSDEVTSTGHASDLGEYDHV